MENETNLEKKLANRTAIIVILVSVLVVAGFIFILEHENQISLQKAIELNQTLYNASMSGYQAGIWNLAYEQTTTGKVYFLANVSGNLTLQSKTIQEICGSK